MRVLIWPGVRSPPLEGWRFCVLVSYCDLMHKKRTSKASLRRELMAKERQRIEQVAEHMSTVAVAVDEVEQACLNINDAVEALRSLDKTLADIESARGIPSKRISQLRRLAESLQDENDEHDQDTDEERPDESGDHGNHGSVGGAEH